MKLLIVPSISSTDLLSPLELLQNTSTSRKFIFGKNQATSQVRHSETIVKN